MLFSLKKDEGFTFLEILIVVIIAGVLTGFSSPLLKKAFDSAELDGFVKDIYYLSRYLQGSAVEEGKLHYLSILPEKGEIKGFYVENGSPKDLDGRFKKTYKIPKGVVVAPEPLDKTTIFFYPDSHIDPVTINFENRHKNRISLIVKGVIGEIKIQ